MPSNEEEEDNIDLMLAWFTEDDGVKAEADAAMAVKQTPRRRTMVIVMWALVVR